MSLVRITISISQEDLELVKYLGQQTDRSDSYIIRHAVSMLKQSYSDDPQQLELDLGKQLPQQIR